MLTIADDAEFTAVVAALCVVVGVERADQLPATSGAAILVHATASGLVCAAVDLTALGDQNTLQLWLLLHNDDLRLLLHIGYRLRLANIGDLWWLSDYGHILLGGIHLLHLHRLPLYILNLRLLIGLIHWLSHHRLLSLRGEGLIDRLASYRLLLRVGWLPIDLLLHLLCSKHIFLLLEFHG